MAAKKPTKKAPAEAGVMRVSLRDHLPRMRSRLELLPAIPERQRAIDLVDFIESHWEQYGNMDQRKTQILGCALFVGEVEHLVRIDALLAADHDRRQRQAAGGKNKSVPMWHSRCVSMARSYLATGTERHELAGKLSRNFHRDPKTIRAVLKKAGIR
ncbi:hypothetical protein [Stenotrophomonas sp. MMGLT7]|uniref:hypothetical protein n=1 Tax=Stenotrophomonas sp. MMGLT7 TaxID=2901227 RepID=UPI001E43F6EC|nr:hypothetical protein [Stenotrophomonas sp. MMGLT7]MCD7097184.1 hypothetical protein [Stenotrophomonas sp. MMGLT7]